jgi:hypothetical protein
MLGELNGALTLVFGEHILQSLLSGLRGAAIADLVLPARFLRSAASECPTSSASLNWPRLLRRTYRLSLPVSMLEDHLHLRVAGRLEDDLRRNYALKVTLLTLNSNFEGHGGVPEIREAPGQSAPGCTFRVRCLSGRRRIRPHCLAALNRVVAGWNVAPILSSSEMARSRCRRRTTSSCAMIQGRQVSKIFLVPSF